MGKKNNNDSKKTTQPKKIGAPYGAPPYNIKPEDLKKNLAYKEISGKELVLTKIANPDPELDKTKLDKKGMPKKPGIFKSIKNAISKKLKERVRKISEPIKVQHGGADGVVPGAEMVRTDGKERLANIEKLKQQSIEQEELRLRDPNLAKEQADERSRLPNNPELAKKQTNERIERIATLNKNKIDSGSRGR